MPFYHLFGPIEVIREGGPVQFGGPKQRAGLAALLLNAGRVVSVDRLADAVWGDEHPPSMVSSLQAHISNLRRLLRDGDRATSPIVRRTPGYLADISLEDLDLRLFERACDETQAAADAGDWPGTLAAADRAAALRRGPLLAEFSDEPWVRGAAAAAAERWVQCEQNAVIGLLGLSRVTTAVLRSRQLLADTPLAEGACRLHMISLYRAGRPAEALEVFREHARRLDEELGLEVSPALRDLQGAVLRQDAGLDSWPGRASTSDPAGASAGALGGVGTASTAGEAGTATTGGPADGDPADGPVATTDGGFPARSGPGCQRGDLVGRVHEIAVLESVLDEALTGDGRWVVLTGPAGIGKSRLAQEAAVLWARSGGAVARTGCPDDEAVPPW
ncbi:BTAD domain-containing putative transcriptional regulator, partial [Glutamicibacter sp. V16R2B1]|uniref:BTAD domain-containing putative transcriptional regulator n=1 Tax=Glutamicibacter sp. V16R2B1 TaxID=2036207 RepID=UPI0012747BF6